MTVFVHVSRVHACETTGVLMVTFVVDAGDAHFGRVVLNYQILQSQSEFQQCNFFRIVLLADAFVTGAYCPVPQRMLHVGTVGLVWSVGLFVLPLECLS